MKKDPIKPIWCKEVGRYVIREKDAFEYVMENMYDEVKEAVFEQEAESQRE